MVTTQNDDAMVKYVDCTEYKDCIDCDSNLVMQSWRGLDVCTGNTAPDARIRAEQRVLSTDFLSKPRA